MGLRARKKGSKLNGFHAQVHWAKVNAVGYVLQVTVQLFGGGYIGVLPQITQLPSRHR